MNFYSKNPGNEEVRLGSYDLPEPLLKNLYEPYIAELREAHRLMRSKGFEPLIQFEGLSIRQKLAKLFAPLTDPLYRGLQSLARAWRRR